MTITEPMTMLTDYTLAGVTGWLGLRLWRVRDKQQSRAGWSLAFEALALGAVLGGTYHGFAQAFDERTHHLLWRVTTFAIGIASFGMLAGSALAATTGAPRRTIVALAAVKLASYSAWMLLHDAFIYAIADTGIAMAAVGAMHGWRWVGTRDRASLWILGGVGVSALAAAVQASGLVLHRHFNHNDLYHVVQVAAMALFYLGARQLRDCAEEGRTRYAPVAD